MAGEFSPAFLFTKKGGRKPASLLLCSEERRRCWVKSKYETHVLPYLDRIEAWARSGATAKEIAGKLQIAYSTFRKYLDAGEKGDERYQALSAAFARGCVEPDDEVEAALYKRACGIEYEEKTFERKPNKQTGELEEVCTKRVTKFIPPDPTSCMFWLANRRPKKWKYHPENETDNDEDGKSVGVILMPEVKGDG